jgi:UV DNA damage endonuclease
MEQFMHSFDTSVRRIGFACKWSEINKKGEISSVEGLNTGGTTLAWATRNKRNVVEEKIMDVARQNIMNTHALVKKIATLPKSLRMLRLTSDMFSFYTHDDYKAFWKSQTVQDSLHRWMAPIGETARKNDIRLSFHPDQFCCIASDSDSIVNKSIEELEYHADMARWMGYGKTKLDFKINVHLSGRRKSLGLDLIWDRISPELRNCLTLENDEYQTGLDDLIKLGNKIGIVLDIHHHFIHTGDYIQSNDDRIKRVIDSWQGVRPTIHYSVSREEYLPNHDLNVLPNLNRLIESGINKQKLRAHSDYMWSNAVNDWAKTHWEWSDIMVEAKSKNLASFDLYQKWH